MITCEHNSCMKELSLGDFKRRDVYPCCGKAIGQIIPWPLEEELPQDLPEMVTPFEEEQAKPEPVKKPAKAPAKKKTSKAKKAKK